jgi:hypothetical protein
MYTFNERYNFYTNNIFNESSKYIFNINKEYKTHKQNEPYYLDSYDEYYYEFVNMTDTDIFPFIMVTNDGCDNHFMPCLQKTRKIIRNCNYSILIKGNQWRHWTPFYSFTDNIKWTDKKNNIIWRGAQTGCGDRIKFCELYHTKYDIGMSSLTYYIDEYSYLLKNEITQDDFCQYKYIISIEGNDKDSGLNWKLASNSVIIMKCPTVESWLMESKLEPWVHYIPLDDDLQNLDDIYEWCLNNDDKCIEIVKNANLFMDNFKDLEMENKLLAKIKNSYKNKITITFNE